MDCKSKIKIWLLTDEGRSEGVSEMNDKKPYVPTPNHGHSSILGQDNCVGRGEH